MSTTTIPSAVVLAFFTYLGTVLVGAVVSPAGASAPPAITIVSPRDGARTNERTAVVKGTAPVAPRGGEVDVTVSVNGRPLELLPRGRRFRATVVLGLGVNRITANAEVYGPTPDDEDRGDPVTASSDPVSIERFRGPGTGVLNLATAFWAANDSEDVYRLCGEADFCLAEPVCVRLSSSRIDCPVKSRFQPDRPLICGLVITVQLRGRRAYMGSYSCNGHWHANSRAFVQPRLQPKGERFRVDERQAPWLAEEINEPNRYGIPRFDVRRDLFIP